MVKASITMDDRTLHSLAFSLEMAPVRAIPGLRSVIRVAAHDLKERMQADFGGHTWFRAVPADIEYDILGDGLSAEIGAVAREGKGHGGPLAHIAYYGGARGGGGTVTPPEVRLAEESKNIEFWILQTLSEAMD